MAPAYRIERHKSPKGPPETPFCTPRGYKMADPRHGAERHHAKHAIYVGTLAEVVDGLRHDLSLWMKQDGKRETLICSASLRVLR
jgi:hypothetical protein